MQFDCSECIILEYGRKVYQKSNKKEKYKEVNIVPGKVNLDTFEMASIELPDKPVQVRRTADNVRKRPNEQTRHNPIDDEAFGDHELNMINSTDLEWMSLNYRKYRVAKLSASRRRIIMIMFQEKFTYFPSMREIRD